MEEANGPWQQYGRCMPSRPLGWTEQGAACSAPKAGPEQCYCSAPGHWQQCRHTSGPGQSQPFCTTLPWLGLGEQWRVGKAKPAPAPPLQHRHPGALHTLVPRRCQMAARQCCCWVAAGSGRRTAAAMEEEEEGVWQQPCVCRLSGSMDLGGYPGAPQASVGRGRDKPTPQPKPSASAPKCGGICASQPTDLVSPTSPVERGPQAVLCLYAFFLPSWKTEPSRNFQHLPALLQL